ncbi:MAG: replication-associated recombination protein A [Planctomycetota bacterium]
MPPTENKDNRESYYQQKAPLAERMRPASLDEFLGQGHLMGGQCAFRQSIETDRIGSMIFWGPPGTGKTTLGRLIALITGREFIHLSAVTAGIKAVKDAVQAARDTIRMYSRGTILFIDEIHRFNKAQQDALLPHVEDGTLTLIGATTENPSFEVNNALLSRCKVEVLQPLGPEELREVLLRALQDKERGLGKYELHIDDKAVDFLVSLSMGDARVLLNNLELTTIRANSQGVDRIELSHAREASGTRTLHYDRNGEEHFNLISALHKSLRGSDPQAALYYLMRMLAGGEDPLYVARRMVRFASEDVGCADPAALAQALAAMEAVKFLGMPECDTALGQAAVYLATAPKSNRVYVALKEVTQTIDKTGHLPVPLKIRNAPTKLMKNLGYGHAYQYPHDSKEGYIPDTYLPGEISAMEFYTPSAFGFEKEISKRIAYWKQLREKKSFDSDPMEKT